jgi:hypothetical protein
MRASIVGDPFVFEVIAPLLPVGRLKGADIVEPPLQQPLHFRHSQCHLKKHTHTASVTKNKNTHMLILSDKMARPVWCEEECGT